VPTHDDIVRATRGLRRSLAEITQTIHNKEITYVKEESKLIIREFQREIYWQWSYHCIRFLNVGQRSARRKWIHLFEEPITSAIIFFSDISAYLILYKNTL
jgi:hypothetical protein